MKKTGPEVNQRGDELPEQSFSSAHGGGDPRDSDWTLTRRSLLRRMTFAGIGLAMPWGAVSLGAQNYSKKRPGDPFKIGEGGETVTGPFGRVRVVASEEEVLPILVEAAGGLAVMDFTGRAGFVRFGRGKTAVTLTSSGVKFGEAGPEPWGAGVTKKLVAAVVKDRNKARGAMLLRSTLHTAYPVAVREVTAKRSKKPPSRRMARASRRGAASIALHSCTTRRVVEEVERCVGERIPTIKTAEEQYAECYDRAISRDPCKSLPPLLKEGCVTAACVLDGFADIVTGFMEVLDCVVEPVEREVQDCVLNPLREAGQGVWPNAWDLTGGFAIAGAAAQPRAPFTAKEVEGALKLLKEVGGFLGPFGCLLEGKWSLAQLDTPLRLGEGGRTVVIPYGVKVCLGKECAMQLCEPRMFWDAMGAWAAALSVLAALSPEFAAATGGFIAASAPVVAIAATLPPAVVAAAAIILAFLLLVLIYGTAISGQLAFQRLSGSLERDQACIVHPTFAIALISLLVMNTVPVLIPPIVVME